MTNFKVVEEIALRDVMVLIDKDASYGSSWQRRGGVGAFMMMARKWDRIEQQANKENYDVFRACGNDMGVVDNLLDDIADLRRYLLLVEEHVRRTADLPPAGPGPEYVNQ